MSTIDTKKRASMLAQKRSEIERWKERLSHADNAIESRNIQAYIDELEEDYRYVDKTYHPTVEESRERYFKVMREDFPNDFID